MTWDAVPSAWKYSVRYKATSQGWGSWVYDTVTTNSYSLTGLSSTATSYHWQVATMCDSTGVNNSVFSSYITFTTIAACTTPTGMNTTNILLDRATLNWALDTNTHHYSLRFKVQGASNWAINIPNILGNSRTIFNLSSGSTYDWQIRSVCSSDSSSVSAWTTTQSFTTLTPCTTPLNPNEFNVTTTSATLVWDSIPGVWGYKLVYQDTSAAWNTRVVDTLHTNITAISPLIPGTTYRWRVQSMCDSTGINKSSFTAWQYFSTLSGSRITAGNIELMDNLNVYPNPTRGLFNISFISEKIDNFEITIIDAFGKIILHEDKKDFIGEYTKMVDLSNWPRGIYMIQIKTQDSFVSKRIVIQ
ncbi:MAG TPA: T9SS type A sorting domain-containing protein [Flavobacteriales bacterium]|nr:T9SS type A sorting domain-containing protein [Flavobacteriales bacterium]